MKILFLNSPWVNNEKEYCVKSGTRWAAIRKKNSSLPYFPFPYFMAWAATILKNYGFETYIKDAVAEQMSKESCLQYVEEIKPNILVIEAFTPSIYIDLEFAKEAKDKTGCMTAFCGAHATALPQDILKNHYMDFVFIGEYAYTLLELGTYISRNRHDFENIKGLAFKQNDKIKISPKRSQAESIDDILFPDYSQFKMDKYNEPLAKYYPSAKIVSTRGCPHNCIFCIEPLMYGRIYNKRPVYNVIEEIKMLQTRYGVKEIYFDDAIFTIGRAKEIAQGILDSKIKVFWTCWMDWNIDNETLKFLKKSGCIALKFGIESANSEIMKTIGKTVYIDKIEKVIKNCKQLGLKAHGSFILGLPGETKQSLNDTVDLAFSLGIDSCQVSIATPLPGTPFYDIVVKNKWLAAKDWTDFDGLGGCTVSYPGCSKDDILNAMEEVKRRKVKQFLKNPLNAWGYVWKLYQFKGFKSFFSEITGKTFFVIKSILN